MKTQTRRLALEALESRWCPAVTASLSGTTLTISGNSAGEIAITQDSTTAGTITVKDNGAQVGTGAFTGVKNIKLNLTEADDKVTIDLGGNTLAGSVSANLGAGANSLTVEKGTIAGGLFTSGEAPQPHFFFFRSRPKAPADTGLDTITLAKDATVKYMSVQTGAGGADVSVDGDVTGDLSVTASSFFFSSSSSNGSSLTVTGGVDGNLFFGGSSLADTLDVEGDVGKSLTAFTGGGADIVTVNGAVLRGLWLDTGSGDDQITLAGTVGGRTFIWAGDGTDSLTMESTAQFLNTAVISMGGGTDSVKMDATVITTMLLSGGTGTDTFTGNTALTGLTLFSF